MYTSKSEIQTSFFTMKSLIISVSFLCNIHILGNVFDSKHTLGNKADMVLPSWSFQSSVTLMSTIPYEQLWAAASIQREKQLSQALQCSSQLLGGRGPRKKRSSGRGWWKHKGPEVYSDSHQRDPKTWGPQGSLACHWGDDKSVASLPKLMSIHFNS